MDPPRVVSRRGPGEGPVFRTHFKKKILKTPSPSISSIKRPESCKSEGSKKSSSADVSQNSESPSNGEQSPSSTSTKFKPIRRALSTQYQTPYAPKLDILADRKGLFPKKDKKPSKKSDVKAKSVESFHEALPESYEYKDLEALWFATNESFSDVMAEDFSFLADLKKQSAPACRSFLKTIASAAAATALDVRTKPPSTIGAEVMRSSWCPPPLAAASADFHANDLVLLTAQHGGADEFVWSRLQGFVEDNISIQAQASPRSGFGLPKVPTSGTSSSSTANTVNNASASPSMGNGYDNSNVNVTSVVQQEVQLEVQQGVSPSPITVPVAQTSEKTGTGTKQSDDTLPSTAQSQSAHHRIPSDTSTNLVSTASAAASANEEAGTTSAIFGTSSQTQDERENMEKQIISYVSSRIRLIEQGLKVDLGDSNASGSSNGDDVDAEEQTPDITEGPVRLGKRGRLYVNVWDEDDFLEKTNQQEKIRAIGEWSDLFHSYSEPHDGAYRDWLMQNSRGRLLEQRQKPLSKKQRRIGGIYFDKPVHNVTIDVPPVPVAVQHPACWGLHTRNREDFIKSMKTQTAAARDASRGNQVDGKCGEVKDDNSPESAPAVTSSHSDAAVATLSAKGVYEFVHPAAFTSNAVQPPGVPAAQRDFEDYDVLNIHADVMVNELRMLEASNYARMQHLLRVGEISSMLDSVRERKKQLSALLFTLFRTSTAQLQACGNDIYQTKPEPFNPYTSQVSSAAADDEDDEDPEVENMETGRYGTRRASDKLARKGAEKPQPQLGACLLRHVSFGSFVARLARGMPVEVFAQGRWQAAIVARLQFDGILLRHIKVAFLGSSAADSIWVSVEDGRLSPPGEHVDLSIFKCFMSHS